MASEEGIALLRSIDGSLKQLVALSAARRAAAVNGNSQPSHEIASDKDLESQWGDPIIKATDPRDWTGGNMKGRHFSECPPEYLDLVASRLDYFAKRADENGEVTSTGKPKSKYSRLDASRARGWAARMRAGKVRTPNPMTADDVVDANWATGNEPDADLPAVTDDDGWAQ